jgi:RNA polymerase sigma-70 factor (ECF subfamily)
MRAGRLGNDEVLLARVQAGDDTALGHVYDQHAELVFGIARRVTADEHLAKEVVQDVFVHLWEAPQRVDLARGSIRSYLGVVAHRRAVDAVRRAVRRGRAEAAGFDAPDDRHGLVDDEVADADARTWCRTRLATAIEELPAEQRAALVLAYVEGRTFKEVARLLGIPEGTAKSRVRLAIARVRANVGGELRAST